MKVWDILPHLPPLPPSPPPPPAPCLRVVGRYAIESDTVEYLADLRFVITIFINIYGLEEQLKRGGGFLLQQVTIDALRFAAAKAGTSSAVSKRDRNHSGASHCRSNTAPEGASIHY